MRKTIYKTTILMLAAIFICQPLQLKADGGLIPYNYEDLYEPSQTSLIVYDNGKEDLYLKVNYEGETNKFVWLVPTPSFPKASKAPKDLFEELSALTVDSHRWGKGTNLQEEGLNDSVGANVIMHSQENIGIYEVTVLSATGADGLFNWLNNHGYKMSEDVKEILDWYIQKEWYFTAMRIEPGNIIIQAVEDLQVIDSLATKENFSEKLAEYYVESFKNNNYSQLKITYAIFMDIYGLGNEEEITEEIFNQTISEEMTEYDEEDWLKFENSTKEGIDRSIKRLDPENVSSYSDYLEPIKISFATNSIVYPLKISQFSTRVPSNQAESPKTNEVLLYILSDNQVQAPGFELEYAQDVNPEIINNKEKEVYGDLESLKEIINKECFLTKLRRKFAKVEMNEDLYFISSEDAITDDQLNIYFFWGENCPHCEKEKIFLSKLEEEYVNLKIYSYEIYNNDGNKETFKKVIAKLNISSQGVPLLVVGNDYVLGYANDETTGKEIKEKVEYCLEYKCTDLVSEMEISLVSLTQSYEQNDKYQQAKNQVQGSALLDRLKGMIVLKVEENGEAYYINPKTKIKRYLGRPGDAFAIMRGQGMGITNDDLEKIPVGLDNLSGIDTDSDGLSDLFEDAIGTNKNNKDSDGDGYKDKSELETGYNSCGAGKINLNINFANSQKGKIFLQVENNGEAWYVNPKDAKRYFLGRPADAFNVMRNLGLGISNNDFNNL